MNDQPRRPAGGPDGGQFAEAARAESAAELEGAEPTAHERGLGWMGTFYAAPDFTTAEQIVNYFDEHLPPDTTVAKLRRLANERETARANARFYADMEAAMRHWDEQNPSPEPSRRRRDNDEQPTQHRARREAFQTSVREQLWHDPEYKGAPFDAYSALLACQITRRWEAARQLEPAEREKLNRAWTGWSDETGADATHEWVIERWGLDEFKDQVLDPEADQRDLLNLLRGVAADVDRHAWTQNEVHAAVENIGY